MIRNLAVAVLCAPLLIPFVMGGLLWGQERDKAKGEAEAEKEFRKRVNRAVDAGAAWLEKIQKKDGSWAPFQMHDHTYEVGHTALAVLALLASGVKKTSKSVSGGLAFIQSRPVRSLRTYEVGISLMAMEMKYIEQEERLKYQRGESVKVSRNISPEDKKWIKEAADFLLETRHGAVFAYPQNQPDHSNTQYGVLGLKAAARCGVKIKKEVWFDLLRHFLKTQEQDGPRVKLLLRYKEEDKGGKGNYAAHPYKAYSRGWAYQTVPAELGKAYGSMTTVGVSSLIICESELEGYGRMTGRYKKETSRAILDGLAWLQENFAVDHNPKNKDYYHFYYLYGLERAGVLSGVEMLGTHAWYREGAEYLLQCQRGDGCWFNRAGWGSHIVNTCFALLFLKRSTVPAYTTPRVRSRDR